MRSTARDSTIYLWSGVAIASIWISVVLASIFAADLVSGTEQDHISLVPAIDWIWGGIATSAVALTALEGARSGGTSKAAWTVLGIGVAAVWLAVLLVSLYAPVMVTGTDPTRLPLAAVGAPIVGMVATKFICNFVKTASGAAPLPQQPAVSRASTWVTGNGYHAEESAAVARLRELAQLRDADLITADEFEAKKDDLLARI